MEKNYEKLDLLNKIHKVDPPPFLYTRILQKIESAVDPYYNKGIARSIVLSLFVVLMINFMVIGASSKNTANESTIVDDMNLMPNNTLYHE
ncbi:MAG: hypothetical protein NT150_15635 [Bacteroidetes bacterium]|nr:hypothetical protein [Bacteroidota bacterium]